MRMLVMLISWTRWKRRLGSTPRPLKMLGGDRRFVDHPVAKSNSGEGAEPVILTASLGIFDATPSSWAAM
jgi:hypothetical protein